jgi:hypothetical protein
MWFQSFCDNIKYKAIHPQRSTLFWRPCRKQRIMLTARNSLICLELSCWLSASAFAAVWLLLKKKRPKLRKVMKSNIWSKISVVVFCEGKPCQLVRSNMFWSCLVPSTTCSWSTKRQFMLHFLMLRNASTDSIMSQKFWISGNTIFKNLFYRRRGCLIWSISKVHCTLVRSIAVCIYIWKIYFSFAISKIAEMPDIENSVKL